MIRAGEYSITLGDRAGTFLDVTVDGFAACCDRVRELAAKYPDKVLVVSNVDRCDYDTDGLTDDEREALWEAEAQGNEAAKARKAVRQ